MTVDHGLQPGSGERAASVAALLSKLGLDPVRSAAVTVAPSLAAGPEAAARVARYGALDEAAISCGAAAILLGHTLDDQAETVLLPALARGSGGRSLAGMAARRGPYRRPLLGVRRATTSAACAELGLEPWQDPHNRDFRFARARVRHQALPALEAALGPGVAEALARPRASCAPTPNASTTSRSPKAQLCGYGSNPAGLDDRLAAGAARRDQGAGAARRRRSWPCCWRGVRPPGSAARVRRSGHRLARAAMG